MNENNELLMHLYQISDMGVKSTTKLLNILKNKDNKIKKILEDELKEYEKYLKKSEKILTKEKIDPKSLGTKKKLENYKKEIDKKTIDLAKELIEFQQKEIENLKNFL